MTQEITIYRAPFEKKKLKASIYFYWKKPHDINGKVMLSTEGTIYAQVFCNGSRNTYSTGIKCFRGEFKGGTIHPNSREAQDSRSKLIDLKRNMSQIKIEPWFNPKTVWNILIGSYIEGMYEHTILNAIDKGLESASSGLVKKSVETYSTVVNSMNLFVTEKLGYKDVAMSRVNIRFALAYIEYLQECGISSDTTANNLRVLSCLYERYMTENPDESYPANPFRAGLNHIRYSMSDVIKRTRKNILEAALSDSQIQDIMDFEFYGSKRHSLNRWKQVAVFQIFTGFAFDDVGSDAWKVVEVNGSEMIEMYRGKTGNRAIIPLLPQAKAALGYLEEERKFSPQKLLFPFKTFNKNGVTDLNMKDAAYARYTRFLAKFSEMLGFHLRTHQFRHTFGMMMSRKGVSLEAIAKMMGHSTSTTTEKFYVQPEDGRILDEILERFPDFK